MAVQIERNNLIDGGVFYVEKNNAINYVPLVIVEISGALEVVQFDPPTNIRETGDSESSVTWEWTAAKHATEYQYQTRLGALGSWSAESIVAGTSVTVTSLASDSSYDIRIRSKNGTLLGEWSSPVSGTTDVDIPPPVTDPVTPSTPRETADSSDSITWTWSSHSENTGGHEWGLRTGSGNAFRSSNQSSNRLKTGDLTPTSTYQLRVRGLRHGRRSAWSAWGTGTTGAVDDTPAPAPQPHTPTTTPTTTDTSLRIAGRTRLFYRGSNRYGSDFDITVSGGTSPYTYAWSGHTGGGLRAGAIFEGGLGASYSVSVTVTDSAGDTASRTFSGRFPTAPPAPPVSPLRISVSASVSFTHWLFGGNEQLDPKDPAAYRATASGSASGGVPPYSISGSSQSGITGQSYTVSASVTDSAGNSASGSASGTF